MTYTFKMLPELAWFVGISILTALFTALIEFDPAKITDWRAWGIALFAAAVRAAAGAALAVIAKPR